MTVNKPNYWRNR